MHVSPPNSRGMFPSKAAEYDHAMRLMSFAVAFVVLLGNMGNGSAQVYPSRPITMVVPFPPGGPMEAFGRIAAERMKALLGQPVILQNVAGAAGSIGVGRVVRAPGDGYTLGIGSLGTHVVNGAIYALPYDLLKDLEPVALLTTEPLLISVKNAMPAHNLDDVVGWLKENPDRASQGTQGVGSAGHIGGILFQNFAGTRYQFVPYRGSAPAMQDLVAGQIDMIFDSPVITLPQVRAGSINALAVAAKVRLAGAPNIPTVDEAGLPGFYVSNWRALWAPKGTPKDVIVKLNMAVMDALADPTVRQRFADLGQEIFPTDQQTPEALGAFQKAAIEKW
jgi:tripartite-type tricarboxylate transporter receptor subunit TctC